MTQIKGIYCKLCKIKIFNKAKNSHYCIECKQILREFQDSNQWIVKKIREQHPSKKIIFSQKILKIEEK